MKKPKIIRKRYIPLETVDISDDEVLFRDDEVLITKWKPIRPREDINFGISYSFLKEGVKIGRFYDYSDKFLYWYCDIVDIDYNAQEDTFIFTDLLSDVKIMPDGRCNVLDLDELAAAIGKGLISMEQACSSVKKLNKLLDLVIDNNFPPQICNNPEYWQLN